MNKYSLNSPLDLYVKVDPEVYKLVSKFLKMNNVETYFLKFENYLNFYSINGPENTFFYGPVLLLLSFYFLTINPNSKYLLIFVIMVFLFCLNNFYFFSLLPITKLILPFIRSVTRSLVIVDFIYILLLINFLNHINSKTKFSNIFNTIAIFLLVISITVNYKFGINYNYSDFYISNGTYSNDIKMKLEKKYIENYLSIINPQVTFDNSSPFKLNLNFENDNNKNLYKLNNLFSVEKF